MTTAEWHAHMRAWVAAGAMEAELWTRLSRAEISDADQRTLATQREMDALSPQEAAHRLRRMLGGIGAPLDAMSLTDLAAMLHSASVGNGQANAPGFVGAPRSTPRLEGR